MRPLSAVVFLDGRLGHEKQTNGILQALAVISNFETIDRKVIEPTVGNSIRYWTRYMFSGLVTRACDKNGQQPVDLIIGTGTHVHLPMLLYKKCLQKATANDPKVVTCMTPDPMLLNQFDLCCIPNHDFPADRENIFVTLGVPNNVVFSGKHASASGLILLGGLDSKSHEWDSRDILGKVKNIINSDPEMSWTISSSPRTPEDTCNLLNEIAETMEKVSFFRSRETASGWIEEQYALHANVWVTADSMSMIYEALTAGCSVGVLPVQWKRADNKFQKSIGMLVEKGLVVQYGEWQAGAPMPIMTQEPLNESRRCAEEILRRWWPGRLP